MNKLDYFLGSLLIISMGLNAYLVLNVDKMLPKEEHIEIINVKNASLETDKNVNIKPYEIKPLKSYKLVLGRDDPFAPLIKVKENKETNTSQNLNPINNPFIEKKESFEERVPYELKGILKGEEKGLVILEKEGDDKGIVLEEGSLIDGYKIYKIDVEKGEIILRKGNISYKLRMKI
jgi:hypothetical protein